MDTHLHPEEDRKFKCDECGRAYRHAGSLSNHKKTHDVGSFECNICGKENSNALALKNHLRSHTSQKKYPCLECGKAFNRPSQLVTHERVHESKQTKEQSPIEIDMEYVTRENQNGHADYFPSTSISTPNSPSDHVTDAACNTDTERKLDKPCKSDLDNKSYIMATHHQRTHKSKGPVDSFCDPYTLSSLDQFSPQNQDLPENFCHLCQVLFSSEDEFQDHIQMHNTSPLFDQNDSAFYDNSTCFSESPFYQPPFTKISSAASQSHSGSFEMPFEQITNDGPFYNCSNFETSSLNTTQMQPSVPVPNLVVQNNNNTTDHTSAEDSEERPYKCEICFKTYRHNGSLVNHKKSHQVGDYQCSVCGKSCPHLASLRSHLRTHKVASSHYRRQNRLTSQLQTMEGHQQTSQDGTHVSIEPTNESLLNGYLNQDSEQTFDFDVTKSQNLVQQQNITSDNFIGSNEHIQDNVENNLDLHGISGSDIENNQFPENASDDYSCVAGEQEEDDRDFYQCSFCGNRYNSIGALRNHMRAHIQSQTTHPSSIPTCMSPREQIKEEELGEVTICCLCGESFSNSQDLVTHQLLHSTNQLENVETLDKKGEVKDGKNLICGSCGIFCTTYSHLENHGCDIGTNQSTTENKEEMREPNNNTDTSSEKEERQFKCDQCGRMYRHSCSLLNHKKSHKTGLFRCHVCQKNFYNLLALKSHQRSHFDIKRYHCDKCGKAYKVQKQLLNHLKRHKKENQVNSQVQILTQIKESSSEGEALTLSADASQDLPSESINKEHQESEATIKEDKRDKRPFACDLCGRTYRHAASLINHKNSHKTGEYLCSICNNSYSNQLAMKNHLRSHFAFKRHSCLKCGKRLRSRKQLSVHVCTNLKRGRRGFGSKSTASSGQTSGSSTKEERFFTCNLCNRSYRHAGSLLNHKNTHKTGHYNCTFCSKHFTNLLALRNHTRIHTQKKKYVCLTCGKAFRLASVLYNHQKVHSRGAGRFSCPDCGKSFRGRRGLQRHQCPQGQRSGTADQQSDKCFKCDLCGRSYHHAGSLLNHKKTHSENLHHCSLCLQTFPDPLALHAHSQINRHHCPECGKIFCLLSHLQSHMEVHGKDQNQVQVDQNDILCDPNQNMIEEEPALLSHVQQKTDSEDKVHVCEHCGRMYRHAGSLLNHKNSHKTGRFFCSVCQKEFTNLMALKNHRRIHTEPKRYQCLECGKAFRASSQLMCHRRIHTRERPFACSVCDKSFSSKSNLRHHEKMHQKGMDANDFMDVNV